MAIAIALILIVIGSIIFHFWSPWVMTPLASNWGTIDDTMVITLIITGIIFIAINLFVAYAVYRFRHTDERRAHYEPENKKLEVWLVVLTTIGIVAMLAPGLIVYAEFVDVPPDAMEVEAVGQQWSWSYRLPGEDGQLGKSAVEFMSIDNPYGIDPLDPNGQDDYLIAGNDLMLPLNRPIKMLMRSKDVLHDFYVPQFRVKMDMVPGNVSYIWFTPTVTGNFEVLCAEFCGVGHFNMRGSLKVVEQEEFDRWQTQQQTFAQALVRSSTQSLSVAAQEGKKVAEQNGCMACHNFDNNGVGPTWQGLYGSQRELNDGSQVKADAAYLKESVLAPEAKVVKGFAPIMPMVSLSDQQLDAVIAYIKERGAADTSEAEPDEGTTSAQPASEEEDNTADNKATGQQLAQTKGCLACHSIDGSQRVGPTWKGLYGMERELVSGQTVKVDDDYLRESIFQPNAKVVAGYPPIMPPAIASPEQVERLIEYIKSVE